MEREEIELLYTERKVIIVDEGEIVTNLPLREIDTESIEVKSVELVW